MCGCNPLYEVVESLLDLLFVRVREGVKYKGGRVWENRVQNGYQNLPTSTTYKEYDINPFLTNRTRGTERLVVGADGSAWLTIDHYRTFTRLR